MDAAARQALLLHIDQLEREIAETKGELRLELERAGLRAPRITDLEDDLANARGQLVETRKSIAARSMGRWWMWPAAPITIFVVVLILARACR